MLNWLIWWFGFFFVWDRSKVENGFVDKAPGYVIPGAFSISLAQVGIDIILNPPPIA